MKIKGKSNDRVSYYDFQFNLTKGNCLKKILELYKIEEIYLCIYGLHERKKWEDSWNLIEIKNLEMLTNSKSSKDIAINIDVSSLADLFSIIKDDFDELLVWSVFTDWKSFVKDQLETEPFLTFRKIPTVDLPMSFFLDFCPYKGNSVEIICDIALSNGVNKDSLVNCLKN